MINFKEVTVQNFWSFGQKPQTLNLDKNQTSMIIGYNRDKGDSGGSRNGVGKSGIFQAVLYCLFGEGMDRIKADNFINFTNKKKMEVSLKLDIDGSEFQIIRGRKPNKLEVYKDGHEYTKDSVRNTDELIEEIIGMDFNIFINTCLLNPHTEPFMNMKGSDQRDFMENLLSLNLLTRRAETLKSLRTDCKTEIKSLESEIETAKKQNEKLQGQITTAEQKRDEWDREQSKKIEDLRARKAEFEKIIEKIDEHEAKNDELKELEDKKTAKQQEIQKVTEVLHQMQMTKQRLETTIDQIENIPTDEKIDEKYDQRANELKEELEGLDDIDFDGLIDYCNKLEEINKEIKEIESQRDSARKDFENKEVEADKLKKELEHVKSGTCPYCSQKWYDEDKVEELKTNINDIDTYLDDIKGNINKYHSQIEEKKDLKASYENEIVKITGEVISYKEAVKLQSEVQSLQNERDRIEDQRAQDKKKANDDYEQAFKMLKKELNCSDEEVEDEIDRFFNNIEEQEQYKTKANKELSTLEEDHYELKRKFDDGTYYSRDKINSIEDKLSDVSDELEGELNRKNPFNEQIDSLKEMMQVPDESTLDNMKRREEHYDVLIKLLTDNKSYIRKNIINQYVPYLNRQINSYLNQLDSQHIVEISPDLSVDVYYLDESVSYGNMSRGERLRLNLGVSLAFRDLVSMLGKNTNLLMIDEYLDSALDPAGFQQVFQLIKGYADHTMIISHRDDLLPLVDEIITVEKINAFTVIDKAA